MVIRTRGSFVNGELDGNKADRLYNCVRQFTLNLEYSDPVEIPDTAMAVIKSNEDIFPAVDNAAKEKAKAMIDSSIEYKHLVKNIAPYVDKMVYLRTKPCFKYSVIQCGVNHLLIFSLRIVIMIIIML